MSRIGKQPVSIPDAVTPTLEKRTFTVKGPKGELSMRLHREIAVEITDGTVVIKRKSDRKSVRSMHGTTRNLIRNLIQGVVDGYEKRLELVGVGYRVKMVGADLELSLGLSHPVVMKALAGITFAVEGQNDIIVRGIDKHLVGQTAANLRRLRPPDPYKAKGIRYKGEVIIKKPGKAGKSEA